MDHSTGTRNMKPATRAAAAALFLLASSAGAAPSLPHPFEAHYALEIFNTVVARATYTLRHENGSILMTQNTRPSGLVSLLRSDRIDVSSRMQVQDGRIYLVEYDYRHSGSDEDKNTRFSIDWSFGGNPVKGRLKGRSEGHAIELETAEDVWDPLSIQVPMMLHAGRDMPPHDHSMVLNDEIREYTVTNAGRETLEISDNRYDAVKLVGREKTRDRAMHIWLSPSLHYLPVRIEQWKDGKLKSTVLLTGASFPDQGGDGGTEQP